MPLLPLHDLTPEPEDFLGEVLRGLARSQKELPCKLFYDERGSALFERICELPEYYLTRTEIGILERHAHAMATCLGRRCVIIEYGSGSSRKTRLLLDQLREPLGYIPVELSHSALQEAAAVLAAAYPHLCVLPVCADYTRELSLPALAASEARRVVFFPGSTIGNFTPLEAGAFLKQMLSQSGRRGGILLGVDLKKERRVLEAAYNDAAGVTAAFNLNLLRRINRELGADFSVADFAHHALYDEGMGRIEMHLVSRRRQQVHINGFPIRFEAGESILTECSYKYALEDFEELAGSVGLSVQRVWTDAKRLFSVQYLSA